MRSVETGNWLAARDAGVLLSDDDPVEQMSVILRGLDEEKYGVLRGKVTAIPRHDLIADASDAKALLDAVTGQ